MKKPSFLKKIIFFLSILGPGVITANVDNDAGGITTYSVAGATFGYQMLWVFLPMILALFVVQEMGVRMGAVTGKGLADLIREKYGVRLILFAMLGLVLSSLGNTIAEFAGVAASLEIFQINRYISVPVSALVVWWLVVKGTYQRVEKIFLIASAIYFSYIISGILAEPPWGTVARETVTPHFTFDSAYLAMLIGLVGTTIAPWMQFYIQSAVVEKGITVKEYKLSRLDVIVGVIMVNVVAIFIVVACAATLHKNGVAIETAKDAASALMPFAGRWASELFAFGLFNASLFAASILPLSTAFLICEALGFEAGVDKTWEDAPVFYWLYTFLVVAGAGIILIPNIPLIPIMIWSQVINGVLLPLVLVFMLNLVNDRDLMGEYVNSRVFNLIAWVTTVIMIILTTLLVISSILPGLFR
ncbi:divalent metal cation transporter [Pelotomaculum terephthalicicum JT]|uniref:NRAMP family divalent metal transporter n=1 Tax=Pelotomaculum TaxID=191373 RepID=UPI0009CDB099|nr:MULTISPECIES: divalent metal cation transporter [Pelotomaculum]MCG9968503.1 divalent metal cation transporter [Pelotomaculum terephthalicicum JT]OPX85056.1 MAG: Divalent metal cation transporter MntH [Pelotomaculum sp. PtaB.Bin117]OPY62744.1 MAG: Divalent metal cation transporter MntH [Pelotomaculum sp. PtaU1.Bin065]